jgi:N-methylhydantoinase B
MAVRTTDPVTLEVLKNALSSLADEMALIVMRTAYSGVIKDALDYSTAFCNRRGEMVAQGVTIALHLGSFPDAVASILERYAGRTYPGDVFIMNDPYGSGGIHLPDVYVMKPVFVEDSLEGFACVVAHQTDVGGIVAGSNSTTATEIYQEGLRIPTLKLFERGVPSEAIFSIIEKNVRVPVKVLGDIRAEVAATRVGERAFLQLVERYGVQTLRDYMDELLDYSERMARAEIRSLPNGRYEFTSYIDHDSVDPDPVVFHVAVTIEDDSIVVDFEGTSPQVRGGINSPVPFSKSAVYAAIRLVMDPRMPYSAGYFRPIVFKGEKGTIVDPVLPGACGARGITGFRIIDTVLGALSQAVPDRVPADGEGGNTIFSIGGYDAQRRPFVYVDLFSGVRGGAAWGDGPEGVPHPGSNNANTPVEMAESELPLLFLQYGLAPDSAGPGKFRGALAQIREVKFLGLDTTLTLRSDKRRFPPYGLLGGLPGAPSMNVLNPDGEALVLPTIGASRIKTNDVLRHTLPGGGGWGDPLERDPDMVQADLWNENMTVPHVRQAYGVVADPDTLLVDHAATTLLRAELRLEHRSTQRGEPTR